MRKTVVEYTGSCDEYVNNGALHGTPGSTAVLGHPRGTLHLCRGCLQALLADYRAAEVTPPWLFAVEVEETDGN